MKNNKIFTALSFVLVTALATGAHAANPPTSSEHPALVLAVVVDQMRYDYLTRYGSEFKGGLKRLLEQGAVFTNGNYEASPTVTAIGHSTILSGATPSVSGIAANTWFERTEGKNVESITDDDVKPLGGGTGASPKRLLVSTVGDELKISGKGGKVYGVSLKNRSAILPAGRSANGAFWFNGDNGNFVSSTWYFDALPAWAEHFNNEHRADKYAGTEWMGTKFPDAPGAKLNNALDASPFADQLVLDFALTVLKEEQLGTTGKTDLLSVSFSAMDYVGHAVGPDTAKMHDMVLTIDTKVGQLLDAAEKQAGRGKVLLVFTADHGVAPVPEENIAKHLPGGRFNGQNERAAVEAALTAAFGEGKYIQGGGTDQALYLNPTPVAGKLIAMNELERVAADALRKQPHIARVYTRTELSTTPVTGDRIDQRVRNGWNVERSGDVIIVHEPNWLGGGTGTNHGTPYSYDTHVPMIFWGPKSLVKPGLYANDAAVHDIAPTLATMLNIATPSGSLGRVLSEILVP